MNKFTLAMKRFGGFLKRNAFYLLIILCIASIATVIALAVTRNKTQTADTTINANNQEQQHETPADTETGVEEKPDPKPDDKPEEPVDKGITFIMPCNGTISRDYTDTMLVWSSTLKEYSTHLGTDFTSEDGNVFASADGMVKEVGNNALDGNYIVLTHKDGYITKYMSLQELPEYAVGAIVQQGELIGKMSTSQGTESLDGNHLHFEMYKNGTQINPLEVFVLEEK